MAGYEYVPDKDPDNVEPYFFVWCDRDGTNTGSATDDGELQGATISSYTVTAAAGITKVSDNKLAVTIHGVAYAINTVVTVWLSGGTDGVDYQILCRVVTSDGRTLDKTMVIPVRAN
jgi:hypothetical protein